MLLYIDISKSGGVISGTGTRRLHKERLVRRAVQVRGKNGKVFTRMQWVDPKTGQPVSKKHHTEVAEAHNKKYDLSTRRGAVNDAVDKMDREEKYRHIKEHGIKFKENANPHIQHKDAVVALKQHMYENPHLLGLEHLPPDAEKVIDPKKAEVDSWLRLFTSHELMGMAVNLYGRNLLKWERNDDPNIDRMNRIMAMKKLFLEKPELREEFTPSDEGLDKAEEKAKEKINRSCHPVVTILKGMKSSDKWSMVDKYDIKWTMNEDENINRMRAFSALADFLKENPHFLNMTEEQKQHLEEYNSEEAKLKRIEAEVRGLDPSLKTFFMKKYGIDTKSSTPADRIRQVNALVEKYKSHPHLLDTDRSEIEKHDLLNTKISVKQMIDIIRRMTRMKPGDVRVNEEEDKEWTFGESGQHIAKINEDDNGQPVLSIIDGKTWNVHDIHMKQVKEFLDSISSMKEEVKAAPKYSKQDIIGILDSYGIEPDKIKEAAKGLWYYMEGKEKGAVQVNGKGVHISIQHPNGDVEYNDDHSAIKRALDYYYSPLHAKPMVEINRHLKKDFEGLYKGKVKEAVLNHIRDAFQETYENIKRKPPLSEVYNFAKLSPDVIDQVAKAEGFEGDKPGYAEGVKKLMLGHLVSDKLEGNAYDYVKSLFGEKTNWALNHSAKKWTEQERLQARKDLISGPGVVSMIAFPSEDHRKHIQRFIGSATRHMPFDLLSDMLVNHGLMMDTVPNAHANNECHYNPDTHSICVSAPYFHDDMLKHRTAHEFFPQLHDIDKDGNKLGTTYTGMSWGHIFTHEFAHALDHYLSGPNNKFTKWNNSPTAEKYLGSYVNGLSKSYADSIMKHSIKTDQEGKWAYLGIGKAHGNKYYYHKDNFLSNYEGRIYGNMTSDAEFDGRNFGPNGDLIDNHWNTNAKAPDDIIWGAEHWSESVSRTISAIHHYREYMDGQRRLASHQREVGYENVPVKDRVYINKIPKFKDWARDLHSSLKAKMGEFQHMTPGEVEQRYPAEWHAANFHQQSVINPTITDTILHLINRSDFVEHRFTKPTYLQRIEPNDKSLNAGRKPGSKNKEFTEKSLILYIGEGNSYESSYTLCK